MDDGSKNQGVGDSEKDMTKDGLGLNSVFGVDEGDSALYDVYVGDLCVGNIAEVKERIKELVLEVVDEAESHNVTETGMGAEIRERIARL